MENGFEGGIRELLVIGAYQTQEEIFENANRITNYDPSVKGYYRFAAYEAGHYNEKRFLVEEFRQRFVELIQIGKSNERSDDRFAIDMIPNDICPVTFDTQRVVRIDSKDQFVQKAEIAGGLKRTQYAYSMSLSLYISPETCVTENITVAENECNLVRFENVFMLFFSHTSLARFHFYAEKNYYESQTSAFFLPYD